MYQINGYLQNYAWGIPGGLVAWQSPGQRADADPSKPEAELWYGAHPNGPSELTDGSGTLLDELSGADAPLLVKMLAAKTPLSIQVHPPTDQAVDYFARQQSDSSLPKLLADSLAKTEMLIAVKRFSVFQGLRDLPLSAQIFQEVGPELDQARHELAAGDVKAAMRTLLALTGEDLPQLTSRVPSAAARVGVEEGGVAALQLVADTYPGDPGVFVAALLAHRDLEPGDAVYVPAGVVHAYVQGLGVEVMTASDNVLRLGLTPKTIAVDESLRALNPELTPEPMTGDPQPSPGGGTHRHYAPSDAPFAVDTIAQGNLRVRSGAYRLVLAVEDRAIVDHPGGRVTLNQGEALAILADEPEVSVGSTGVAAVARANR